ncbi:hypothetical protein E2C01_002884 [Portunus trituberculatus]|uniref:Uncharacterized protein n=1 Tax=Portunus trituberculatus TaxID=210409 RepID=A0A5B7CKN0_PORTR|nr:hypothetical protein [Portunus trituberculatus]
MPGRTWSGSVCEYERSSYIERVGSQPVAMTTVTRLGVCHLRSAVQPTELRHEITLGLPPSWLPLGFMLSL